MDNPELLSITRPASRLRIALLLDSVKVSQYVYDLAVWAQSHASLIVTHLIIVGATEDCKNERGAINPLANHKGLSGALSELAFRVVDRMERILIKSDKHHLVHLRALDLRPLFDNIIRVRRNPSSSHNRCQFDAADVQRVKGLNLDLLLQCGQYVPSGDLLNAFRLGVISIHFGDDRTVRGGPAGFWEVYCRHDTSGFAILRLRDGVEVGDVLMRGYFPTRHYYLLNQAFVRRKAYHYLKLVVGRIALSGKILDPQPSFPYSQQVFRAPNICNIVVYLCRRFYSIILKRARRALGVHYRPTVAVLHENWTNSELHKGLKLANRPLHALADPFLIHRNGGIYCFVEDFDYVSRRGCIDVYQIKEGGGIRLGTALRERFHLSFPYLFHYRGELYMCPESSENRDIRIYKCVEFPLVWTLETIAMKNVSAADTMLFERGGKWWMLTNIDQLEVGDHCSELFIFSSRSPIHGEWNPHSLNPVIVDASRARNAGYLVDGETLYRCSQGQGYDFYGKQVLINKVLQLTESSYQEICSFVVKPSFGKGVVGTHHLHGDGQFTAFDFVTSSRIRIRS